jgi:hypothetical protein
MREQTSLIKNFDLNEDEDLVANVENSVELNAGLAFKLPTRNWNHLIDNYNATNKRKFQFTPLQCKFIIEYEKKGVPPKYMFKTLGVSAQRYGNFILKASELNDRLEILSSKESLTDSEYTELHSVMRNPLRLLMSDIVRAEGVADLFDWEQFNRMAASYPEVQLTKMKAKFKDMFADKNSDSGGISVNINLGGDFIKDM